MMIKSEDNDVFKHQGSVKVDTSYKDLSLEISHVEPPKAIEDDEKGSSLPKWEMSAHFTENIIGDVEVGLWTMRQTRETPNHMCYTSTIIPKNVKKTLQDVH